MDARPLILALTDEPSVASALERDLAARYRSDYDVVCVTSESAARLALERRRSGGGHVALVIAEAQEPDSRGIELLRRTQALHPPAKRVVLGPYGEPPGLGCAAGTLPFALVHDFLYRPWDPPDVGLHPIVTDLLAEWTSVNRVKREVVRVVGPVRSRRSQELRDFLDRNAVPYAFYDSDSDATGLLHDVDAPDRETPVVDLPDGRILVQPSRTELAAALGRRTRPRETRYDVAIVGAGPAGLAAAVAAASEGLETVVLERDAVGGQAGTSSFIRNYLGFPRGISGAELGARAFQQASLFGAEFVCTASAAGLRTEGADRVVVLADGSEVRARAVIVATGIAYRRLGIPSLEQLVGAGVFYGPARSEAPALRGRRVVVVGGGNSGGQVALHLARYAERVTLVTRGGSLARTMSDYLLRELSATPNVALHTDTTVVGGGGDGWLESVALRRGQGGAIEHVAADALFVLIGGEPHTSWLAAEVVLDDHGFIVTGADLTARRWPRRAWPLARAPLAFEASVPGVFAAGDVRSGSVKRVASAAGAGAISTQLVHSYLEQDSREPSSPHGYRSSEVRAAS